MTHQNLICCNKVKPISFCILMDLDEHFIKIGEYISKIVDKLGICQEHNPKSIAVGCIYFMSNHYNLGFSKKEIAEHCHTSEVTVTNTFNQMIEYKKYLIPKPKKID